MANGIGWLVRAGQAVAGQAAGWPAWACGRRSAAAAVSLAGRVPLGRRASVRPDAGTDADADADGDLAGPPADDGRGVGLGAGPRPLAAAMVRSVHPAGRLGLLTDAPLVAGTRVVVRFTSRPGRDPDPAGGPSDVRCVVRSSDVGGVGRVAHVATLVVEAVVGDEGDGGDGGDGLDHYWPPRRATP